MEGEVSVNPMSAPRREPLAFYSVAETARLFRLSEMTLYRAINSGEFPAVRIRGRLVVPAGAVTEMTEAALEGGMLVDASAWCRRRPVRQQSVSSGTGSAVAGEVAR
jgi:excisionase family DNA binding protein